MYETLIGLGFFVAAVVAVIAAKGERDD